MPVNLELLTVLLLGMDEEQNNSDAAGAREVAWYYWRPKIEDALELPRGTLDTTQGR